MYVEGRVDECDFTGKKYEKSVKGAHCVAQGATGRFCCVMYAGPEYLEKNNIQPIPRHEAIENCLTTLEAQAKQNGKNYSRVELDVMFIDF